MNMINSLLIGCKACFDYKPEYTDNNFGIIINLDEKRQEIWLLMDNGKIRIDFLHKATISPEDVQSIKSFSHNSKIKKSDRQTNRFEMMDL